MIRGGWTGLGEAGYTGVQVRQGAFPLRRHGEQAVGAVATVTKPIDLVQLVEVVRRHLA